MQELERHYGRIFRDGHAPYAIPAHALDDQDELRAMVRFFAERWLASRAQR